MRLGQAATTTFAVLCGLSLLFLVPPAPAGAQNRTAEIISTSASEGETISCGCKSKDLGGLARRYTLISEERAKNPELLLVDAGDFGSSVEFEPWERTTFVWQAMADMDYDVVTVGPNEMVAGLPALQELLATAPDIAVVSANVTDKQGNLLWPDHVILEKGGITYAITGVSDGSYYKFNLSRGLQASDDFGFQDSRVALERVLPTLQDADVVVVLLQMSTGDARRLTDGLEGIDVAVVGHNPGYTYTPERVGETLFVRSGTRGQYVGTLELTLDGDRIIDYSGRGVPMSEAIRDEPELRAKVDKFNQSYDSRKAKADTESKAEATN